MKWRKPDLSRIRSAFPKIGSACAVALVFLSVISLPSFTVDPELDVTPPSNYLDNEGNTQDDIPPLREESDAIHGYLTDVPVKQPDPETEERHETESNPAVTGKPATAPTETKPETLPETEPETEPETQPETEPETVPETEPAPTTKPKQELTLSDFKPGERFYFSYDVIPLTREQQDIVLDIAEEYRLPVELLYAIMRTETNFNPNLISSTDDYGIMQINITNHDDLREDLGITDFLDFEQNVRAGAYMIHDCFKYANDSLWQILMVYNRGPVAAWEAWDAGVTFDRYCDKILTHLIRYTEIRNAA